MEWKINEFGAFFTPNSNLIGDDLNQELRRCLIYVLVGLKINIIFISFWQIYF